MLSGAVVFDMQDPEMAAAFQNPKLVLSPLDGLIIIDEAQLVPPIYPVLRVLVDDDRRTGRNRRFLLLGSAAPELIIGASESLAGRIHLIPLQGFCLDETGPETFARLWHRGGFPNSFLAPDEPQSLTWRKDFVETFLLRDLPQYGVRVPTPELRRLWMMCAHLHGRLLNVSELGQSLGRTRAAVVSHLDILEQSYVIRRLEPWFENLGKRQRKSPKLYLRDSGLLHALLGIQDEAGLRVKVRVYRSAQRKLHVLHREAVTIGIMRTGLQPSQGRVVHARSAGGEQAAQTDLDRGVAGRCGGVGAHRRLHRRARADQAFRGSRSRRETRCHSRLDSSPGAMTFWMQNWR